MKTCANLTRLLNMFRDWSSFPEYHLLQPPGSQVESVETHSEYHTSWNISIRESHNKPRSAVRHSTQLEIGIPSTSRDSGEHPKGSEEQSKLKLSSRKKISLVNFLPPTSLRRTHWAPLFTHQSISTLSNLKNYVIQLSLHLYCTNFLRDEIFL